MPGKVCSGLNRAFTAGLIFIDGLRFVCISMKTIELKAYIVSSLIPIILSLAISPKLVNKFEIFWIQTIEIFNNVLYLYTVIFFLGNYNLKMATIFQQTSYFSNFTILRSILQYCIQVYCSFFKNSFIQADFWW